MKKILFATHSKGKIKEFRRFIKNCKVFSLNDLNLKDIPEENGKTFEENALIKANYWQNKISHSFVIVAEDAGIEVDALNGKPGVHSARYAKNEKEANRKMLKEMKDIAENKRTARYVSVFAIVQHGDSDILWRATCEGSILKKPSGKKGFGYDPIFFSNSLKKSFGDVSSSEKDFVSHRGKNLKKLQEWIDSK
ncbi:non-canonical purine NTP pyrophosphatase, RdgB/HAM1 family [bacterium]|nr:non-canonical purine NTP pyrophosphatase, RdgB/HAM1 family [bacterium]